MAGSDPNIAALFCHYNALYIGDSLGACAVSWAEDPLPYGHMKQCSGSYYRVQESSPGCSELKGSEALAVETLNERKAEELGSEIRHAKHTSVNCGTGIKHKLEDPAAEFLHRTDDPTGNPGLDSSRNMSNKKIKLSSDTGFDLLTGTTVQEAPKRPRTVALKKNQGCSIQKKRKISKCDSSYSVVIEWLHYYCVDESDEDEVPLINKRTERRKWQKLLKNSQATESNNDFWGASSSSHVINGGKDSYIDYWSQGPRNNNSSENVPASSVKERFLPVPVGGHGVPGDQANHETAPCPSDSPIVGEIVDISDG